MDVGILIIRVVFGLLLAAHGAQKLGGQFGGKGLGPTAAWFGAIGFHPPRLMAMIAGGTEITAGTLFAAGLFMPLAAAGIVGTLVVAIYTHWPKGLWSSDGGFELALLYATGAVGIGLTGAGRLSFDRVLDLPRVDDTGVAAVAMAAATVLSVGVIMRARRHVARVETGSHA